METRFSSTIPLYGFLKKNYNIKPCRHWLINCNVAGERVLGYTTGKTSKARRMSPASSEFTERKRIGQCTPRVRELAGWKNSHCSKEGWDLVIYSFWNEDMKYSRRRGGIIAVPRLVFADYIFPTGGGIFLLLLLFLPYVAFVRTVMATQGVEICPPCNASNIMICYSWLKFTWMGKMASWVCYWPLKSGSGRSGSCTSS